MAQKISLEAHVVASSMPARPLVGAERDEIAELVMRIKRADERSRKLEVQTAEEITPKVTAADRQWADDWQLPREVFEYFVLDRAA